MIDKTAKLNQDRRNLAFGSTLADIDEQFNEMAAELQASREQMEVGWPQPVLLAAVQPRCAYHGLA
jgi:hypothetical protein